MISDEDRQQYALSQYQSLREAILKTRDTQHKILQWNQAASGVLFTAALISVSSHSHRYYIIAQFIFGLILPAILLSGALTWAGELIRMSRAGMFVRSFERAMWDDAESDGLAATRFFIWENFLWSPPGKFSSKGYRNQNIGYIGIALFYGVMYLGSLIGFAYISQWWISVIVCVSLVLLGAVVTIPAMRKIYGLGGNTIDVTSNDLADWVKEIKSQNHKEFLAQSGTLTDISNLMKRLARKAGGRTKPGA